MADMSTKNGKPKLPPLNSQSETREGAPPKKKVVKKKKKPTENDDAPKVSVNDESEVKPTPRKKKAASASTTTDAGGENAAPKKKKRVAKRASEAEGDPSSARSGASASQGEDVSESKASLISKGTPRKKVKKRVKKTPKLSESTEFFDKDLHADLKEITDDIVSAEDSKKEEKDYAQQPYSVASNMPRSQPTEKFYIETDKGFKGENKSKFARRIAEEEAEKAIIHEEPTKTTIAFALSTQKVLRTIFLFFHGILAGFSLWHIVMAYVLLDFGYIDFIEHYRVLAMPVQCIFYLLLVICLVSACDRFDIGNPRRHFLIRAVTLQNGTISVVIYLAALVLSLANAAIEDKINLHDIKPELWNTTAQANSDLTTWKSLNTARGSLSILGWFVLSLAPVADRLTKNLKEADERDLLGTEELGEV